MVEMTVKTITEINYKRPILEKGYNNQFLDVDITKNNISIDSIEPQIKEKFIGGKGFDLWLHAQRARQVLI